MDKSDSGNNGLYGQFKVKHILITPELEKGMDANEIALREAEAKKLAENIIIKLMNGENWSTLVKQYSADKKSIPNDGMMLNFSRGRVDDGLFSTVVKLKDGMYAKFPIQTNEGYHIILRVSSNTKEEEKEEEKTNDEESSETINQQSIDTSSPAPKNKQSKTSTTEKIKTDSSSFDEYDIYSHTLTNAGGTVSNINAGVMGQTNVFGQNGSILSLRQQSNQLTENITTSTTLQNQIEQSSQMTGNVTTSATMQNQNRGVGARAPINHSIQGSITIPTKQAENSFSPHGVGVQINGEGRLNVKRNIQSIVEGKIVGTTNAKIGFDIESTGGNDVAEVQVQPEVLDLDFDNSNPSSEPVEEIPLSDIETSNAPSGVENVASPMESSTTSGSVPSGKSENREKVDNAINNIGSGLLQGAGVPKPLADAAMKTGGGPLSPGNLPGSKIVGNHLKDKMANKMANSPGMNALNSRGSNPFGNLQKNHPSNAAKENENNRENAKKDLQDKALQQGASTAAQAAGVPKPVADFLGSQVSVDKLKKQMFRRILLAALPFILCFFIPILALAGSNDSSYSTSGMANDYLYGEGTDEVLYKYLRSIGHCRNDEECKNSDGASFYRKLKERLKNTNLTKGQADAVIIAFIGYNRSNNEMFKAVEEIDFIADILVNNGIFKIENISNYKESLIGINGSSYFDTYRNDIAKDKSLEERERIFNRLIQNAQNIANMIEYEAPLVGGTCSYNVDGMTPSNIKVKLLECGVSEVSYIDGEELIDFEKYITGVVYAENGGSSYEALKAQAIAARSYALTRGGAMNNALGLGLKNENGQWILSIRNCTADQVYCDPDRGCWSDSASAGDTVHSTYIEGKTYAKGPLGSDSQIRRAVAETNGEVIVDDTGRIMYTPFTSTEQNQWNSLANEGKDYFEILKASYTGMNNILKTCGGSYGDFANWKQCNMSWSSIIVGNSGNTMCDIGCLLTSISIEIAKSGAATVNDFDPGVLINYLNAKGAFTPGGGLYWYQTSSMDIAPTFHFAGHVDLYGSRREKANIIKQHQDQGYYIVIKAKSHEHWVALDYVDGENVYIFDPARDATNIWDSSDYDVVQMGLFQIY